MTARVSFVVPAWNEERLIGGTLDALHAAAHEAGVPYELVVADDASTDGTAEIARERGAVVVPCDNRQIAATRNAGARVADGDLLVFVDADTRVGAAVVRSTLDAVEDGAVYGGADVTWDGAIPLWSRALLRATLLAYRCARLTPGAYMFCTREAFDRVGGFDESFYAAEEFHFARSLRRVGRHGWVRERVVTSGRKLRTHSAGRLLGDLARIAVGGPRAIRSRERLDLWYADRPVDPGSVEGREADRDLRDAAARSREAAPREDVSGRRPPRGR